MMGIDNIWIIEKEGIGPMKIALQKIIRNRKLNWMIYFYIFLIFVLALQARVVQAGSNTMPKMSPTNPIFSAFLEGIEGSEEQLAFEYGDVNEEVTFTRNGCAEYGFNQEDFFYYSLFDATNIRIFVTIVGTPTKSGTCTIDALHDGDISTLTVNIQENIAPRNIFLSNNYIQENMDSGTEIGIFSTQDINIDLGDQHSYTLVGG